MATSAQSSPAPVAFFACRRPAHTRRALEALAANELAPATTLYVFADGPRVGATEEERRQVAEVRQLVRSRPWCGKVEILEAETNRGLADSIVAGVSQVVEKHGRIIVLEDDLVVSPGFLRYMNDALDLYAADERVMHVSGYMWPHKERLPVTLFFNVPLCWGWATWARAWKHFEPDSRKLCEHFESKGEWARFDKFGGDYLSRQLRANRDGTLKTWFVKWHASVLLHNGWTLYPGESLVSNEGFDRSGEHCGGGDKFAQAHLAPRVRVEPIEFRENEAVCRLVRNFYYPPPAPPTRADRLLGALAASGPGRTLRRAGLRILKWLVPELEAVRKLAAHRMKIVESEIAPTAKLQAPCTVVRSRVGRYTYVSANGQVNLASIGAFCSIGPNFFCGWGIHPLDGISTAPMFYSTQKQNGTTLSATDKVVERKPIAIGNDVFIGANVTVLDGTTIGDGAVIGAGAVVAQDVPPYAVAAGSPLRIVKYRFDEGTIRKLLAIRWWEFDDEGLKDVERRFGDVAGFIAAHEGRPGAAAK